MSAIYELDNVRQVYAGRTVLDVESLRIGERRIVGVAGPNGSGKSTLMRILAFLERPERGTIRFAGQVCAENGNGVRRKVTLLTQEPYLLKRSVEGNVAYGLAVRGEPHDAERVGRALDMVGLAPEKFLRRSWRELSGGEAQRVALAARLVLRPRVLLLDEPTASLDEESAKRIMGAAQAARDDWGATIVVVSHDRDWLGEVADETIRMREGRIVS
ncbi:tungstate transport system ATP-binding protein [Desulfobaculum xiamenense]|uniref:Tungstate transport system ATP-binding protein n=1 Tax=Desulfobaculum xiamenense TaxID=995050 RepID=A0A846QGZ3_9BACT|nr:ABC transporter ATP-binding protein [Desulfobaculum xiamenense]NJB66390.1 tungstate transport system ATP-binding protein [Desulfobaculum xiamenense]